MHHTSHVTRHTPHVTHHTSHVTHHTLHATKSHVTHVTHLQQVLLCDRSERLSYQRHEELPRCKVTRQPMQLWLWPSRANTCKLHGINHNTTKHHNTTTQTTCKSRVSRSGTSATQHHTTATRHYATPHSTGIHKLKTLHHERERGGGGGGQPALTNDGTMAAASGAFFT